MAALNLSVLPKHSHHLFEGILPVKTGVRQIAFFLLPFGQPPVIKRFFGVLDDEWDNGVAQAFLECNQSSYSAVPVLEGMDALKIVMKPDNVMYRDRMKRYSYAERRAFIRAGTSLGAAVSRLPTTFARFL